MIEVALMMSSAARPTARMIGEGSLTDLVRRGERSVTVWEYIACPATKSKVLESLELESQVFGNQVLENQAFGDQGSKHGK
jgi:hypothetical protein